MKIEAHLERLNESVLEIEEAVERGIINKQRTIGFHTSAGAIDMLEIILHKNNLIDAGFLINHDWFNSDKKIKEKLSFNFPKRDNIIELIKSIEKVRNNLCYGKRQEIKILEKVINNFNSLKRIFKEVTRYEL